MLDNVQKAVRKEKINEPYDPNEMIIHFYK